MINEFKGKYFFLSNFYDAPVTYEGITYKNNEAAFQAQKRINKSEREKFSQLNPSEAKKAGRSGSLRSDWEQIKESVMYNVCKAKFTQNEDLKKKLIETSPNELIEGNTWGDTTWGQVNGVGKNLLGKILMKIRQEFIDADSYCFDAKATSNELISWIKEYFKENGTEKTKAHSQC